MDISGILGAILPDEDALVMLDVGARNGVSDLQDLDSLTSIHCFEPSPGEYEHLIKITSAQAGSRRGSISNSPFAVAAHSGQVTLNISRRPGATSTLEPNAQLLAEFKQDNWSELVEIVERISVPCITLEDFLRQQGLGHIDFLKLDTQGNELDILQSAGPFIDSIGVVKCEAELIQMYSGQKLLHDIMQFLYAHDFIMIDFAHSEPCRRFYSRPEMHWSEYQLVWGDAIFVRRPYDFAKPRTLHQAAVLASLGYSDLAIHMVRHIPTLSAAQKGALEAGMCIEPAMPTWKASLRQRLERLLGLKIERRDWSASKQVRSARKG